ALCFQLDISPGYCWTTPTSQSQVVISLPTHVQPTAITLQHPLMKDTVLGDISSAPRDFSVVGVNEGGEEETLLGTFTYETEKELSQTFPLQEISRAFQQIKLLIQNNWGNRSHTCIYRVQVDGRIKKTNAKGQ
ncbi:SPAG4 protein, partial [Zapornia atra]|nr:SPAG4 protein [Zapornia atra]